ncbi:MAG: hypothetical protein ABJZ55_03055 [Fuerstiella sp.]
MNGTTHLLSPLTASDTVSVTCPIVMKRAGGTEGAWYRLNLQFRY